jgi:uncharacterized protein DUF2845
MLRRLTLAAGVVSVIILGVNVGGARALDCHGRLVVIGASPWEVQDRCGEPAAVEEVTTYLPQSLYDRFQHRAVVALVPVQQSIWTYNFGSSRLVYYLTFQDGKLIDIKTGDYGH